MSKKKGGLGKFLLGASIGASIGMLFAPKKGSETRRDLKVKFDELLAKAKSIDVDEVRDTIQDKIENIKMELEDLDKEKALKIAKEKAKEVKKMADELVEYTIEKGTPVLEKAASSIKEKTIEVTKDILNKLEKNEK